MVERQVAWLAHKAEELVGAYDAVKPTARLRTFAEVEELWQKVVAPAVPTFLSMQLDPRKTGEDVPEASRWSLNLHAADAYRG